jgi:hypothetical protein
LHVPPLNPSDRIVQPFVQKMRALVCGQDTGINSTSSELSDRQSPLPALSLSAVQVNISRVMSDIISTYSEFYTMSKRVACIMSATSALTVCQVSTRTSLLGEPWLIHPSGISCRPKNPTTRCRLGCGRRDSS